MIFHLDGKSHEVQPADSLLIDGPGTWTSDVRTICLNHGETITMLFSNLGAGEGVVIRGSHGTTTFFRPCELPTERQFGAIMTTYFEYCMRLLAEKNPNLLREDVSFTKEQNALVRKLKLLYGPAVPPVNASAIEPTSK